MDSPNKLQKYKKYKKSTKKYISTKVLITQSFLELQTPDFAWNFIWTVQTNDGEKIHVTREVRGTKIIFKVLIFQFYIFYVF